MAGEMVLTLAADIVSAHVSNNIVGSEQLPGLIEAVYSALADLGQPAAMVEEKLQPAVSIRASIKPDAITCLECGAKMKMLKRHLSTDHNLTPAEYKARWHLNSDYPLVAPEYSAQRKELAHQIALGRKPRTRSKAPGAEAKPSPAEKPARKPRGARATKAASAEA